MLSPDQSVVEKLRPMAVANYLAKLPDMQPVGQQRINQEMMDDTLDFSERMARITGYLGSSAAIDEVYAEVDILFLTISDREEEVVDTKRRAYYARTDAKQFEHRHSANDLEWFTNTGIVVSPQPHSADTLLEEAQADGGVPLVEQFKASRLLTINGFANSRVMHLIHDVVDHPWLFNRLTASGVFDRYSDFLDSIDLTAGSFLYSRQAELVASVGFGSRRWELVKQRGDTPLLDPSDIVRLLQTSKDERCIQAANLFNSSDEVREQAQFVIENMAVQIADERRRYGSVKMRSGNGDMQPMPLMHPLYLAFLVDSVRVLQQEVGFSEAQVQTVCMIEEIMEGIQQGRITESVFVKPLRIGSSFSTGISVGKINWIIKNKAQLTTYTRVS